MKRTETIMYNYLAPKVGEKLANVACIIWQWIAPMSVGGAGGSVIGEATEWKHPSAVALLGAIAVTALFNSIKLIIEYTRGKNKENAELVKLMLDRQDAMRLEQQQFYLEREADQERKLANERRLKHIFVNRLHLSKMKFTALRKGMSLDEVDREYADQERALYDEETEMREVDLIHATQQPHK